MKSMIKAVYAARGNTQSLKKIAQSLEALLQLVRAFQEEAKQSEWSIKNLANKED